jgi:hypothetical protein
MNTELTVGQLRWILAAASDDATIPQALSELAEAKRQDAEAIAHGERQRAYEEYLKCRREREREHIERAGEDAKRAAIASGPISRDNAYMVYKEAADLERLRFEIREPRLEFQEWIEAGKPTVHQIGVLSARQ